MADQNASPPSFVNAKAKPKAKQAQPKVKKEPGDPKPKPASKPRPKKNPEGDPEVPQQAIMAAIMLTAGPVAIQRVVTNSAAFHKISKEQFSTALDALKAANLGEIVEANRQTKVFIKKHPAEAASALKDHPDLCTMEQYSVKYEERPSKSIPMKLRSKLVEMGVVFEKQMK